MERLRRMVVAGLVLFSGTLAVLVVRELSADAMAMLIGVGCGVLAGLPLGLAVLLWTGQARRREARERDPARSGPPVIVVNSGGGSPAGPSWSGAPVWPPSPSQFVKEGRATYRVLGEPVVEGSASAWASPAGRGGVEDVWPAEEGGSW